jgi:hypothetical protein
MTTEADRTHALITFEREQVRSLVDQPPTVLSVRATVRHIKRVGLPAVQTKHEIEQTRNNVDNLADAILSGLDEVPLPMSNYLKIDDLGDYESDLTDDGDVESNPGPLLYARAQSHTTYRVSLTTLITLLSFFALFPMSVPSKYFYGPEDTLPAAEGSLEKSLDKLVSNPVPRP